MTFSVVTRATQWRVLKLVSVAWGGTVCVGLAKRLANSREHQLGGGVDF